MWAAASGNCDVVTELISLGADVDIQANVSHFYVSSCITYCKTLGTHCIYTYQFACMEIGRASCCSCTRLVASVGIVLGRAACR